MNVINILGVRLKCHGCPTIVEANQTADFHGVCCNGEESYYIVCPVCGKKIPVEKDKIPKILLLYIEVKPVSLDPM